MTTEPMVGVGGGGGGVAVAGDCGVAQGPYLGCRGSFVESRRRLSRGSAVLFVDFGGWYEGCCDEVKVGHCYLELAICM
jgi:hypothetical protein